MSVLRKAQVVAVEEIEDEICFWLGLGSSRVMTIWVWNLVNKYISSTRGVAHRRYVYLVIPTMEEVTWIKVGP